MARLSLNTKYVNGIEVKYAFSRKEPCMIQILYINGVQGIILDFGTYRDIEETPNSAFLGCMKRRFLPYPYIPSSVLERHNIQRGDLPEILELLQEVVARDNCTECFKISENIKI
jgi:hypothetical protein